MIGYGINLSLDWKEKEISEEAGTFDCWGGLVFVAWRAIKNIFEMTVAGRLLFQLNDFSFAPAHIHLCYLY